MTVATETLEPTAAQPAADTSTVLSTAAEAPATDWLHDKYKVTKEDGTVDIEASAKKLAEGNAAYAKRMGAGDMRPATPEEYAPEITVEGFDLDGIKEDPMYQDFIKQAHDQGLTNAQVSFAVNQFLERTPAMMGEEQQYTAETCTAALRESWQSDAEYRDGLADALRATAGENQAKLMAKYGNDPDFIKYAASIGKEMREDSGIASDSQVAEQDFNIQANDLRVQLEKMDKYDPARERVQAQLNNLYEKKVKSSKPQSFTISL